MDRPPCRTGAVRSVSAVVPSRSKHPLMIGGHYIHVISRLFAALALFPFRFCPFLLFRLFLVTGIGISAPPILGRRLFYSRGCRQFKNIGLQASVSVIPAKAGIQNPVAGKYAFAANGLWIPAFAGMTVNMTTPPRTWRLVCLERQYDVYWSAQGEFRPN